MGSDTLSELQRRNCVFVKDLGEPKSMVFKKTKNKDTGAETPALVLEGKPIFRSGTFSDSMGFEHTWEALHLNQMVDHATLLSGRGIFEDVPLRKGHPDWGGLFSDPVRNPMDELIGYIGNFRTEERVSPADGNTYTYLLADLEVIEETAIKNIKSGLWRNVSAEISTYVSNGNAEYWPVMYGLAYVDIPAVEGLKFQHSKSADQFSIILEDDMPQEQVKKTDDHSAPPPAAPAPPAPPAPKFEFSVAGKKVTDFAAVQAHIDTIEQVNKDLKQFQTETVEANKVAFVQSLVDSNRIPATSQEAYLNYAKQLGGTQYEAWKGLEETKAPIQMLGAQGGGFATNHEQVSDAEQKEDRVGVLKGIVSQHANNPRMSPEIIKGLDSYKELVSLDPSFSL